MYCSAMPSPSAGVHGCTPGHLPPPMFQPDYHLRPYPSHQYPNFGQPFAYGPFCGAAQPPLASSPHFYHAPHSPNPAMPGNPSFPPHVGCDPHGSYPHHHHPNPHHHYHQQQPPYQQHQHQCHQQPPPHAHQGGTQLPPIQTQDPAPRQLPPPPPPPSTSPSSSSKSPFASINVAFHCAESTFFSKRFQHALNDHDEARNVEQMFLDVAESEESRMSTIPNVPPPPPLTNGVYKSESAADSAYDTSQPPSPGKISTSTAEDDVFHEGENGASFIPPPPLPAVNGNAGRKEEEDELADCGYVSMKDAPPALKHSLKLDNNENEMKVEKKEDSKKVETGVEDLPPPPPVDHQEMASCPNQDVDFPPPPPMAEIAGDTKENIAAIRARFKQQEDKPKEEPLRATSPPRKKIISLVPAIADGAKSESRPEVASPSKSRIAERIAQLKEQEVLSERESGVPAGVAVVRESEYANVPEQTVKRRPPAPVRDPNTRLTMIENTSVQRMSYGNGVDVRMVRTRSEEYRIQSQYGGSLYDDTVVGSTYYDNVAYRNSVEHAYGVIPDVPPPPVQAPPPPPQMSHLPHQGTMRPMSVAAVPPPPAHAPPPVPTAMPSSNTNNTNNIFMQIPGATSRPRSEIMFPEDVPPPPSVAPPPPPQAPPVPSGPKPAHLMSSPVTSSFPPPPPPAMTGFTPPPPPPMMGGPQHIPAPPPMGAMVPPPPPAPGAPPPPPPPAVNKPSAGGRGGGGLLDGISAVQLKTVSKEKKKSLSTEGPMDNLMAELQNFSGRLRPTPKQSKPPSPEVKDETDGVNQFQLKPTKTNGTRADTPSPPQPPSPPQHQNGNNSTQSNVYRLSPNSNGGPLTAPKSPKPTPTPTVMPKPGKVPASPNTAPPAPPNAPPSPQKAFTPPSPPQKAPVAPPTAQKASPPQTSPKRPDYSKRVSMPPETRPLSPTSISAIAERTRKVSAPGPSAPLPMQLPEGYDNMPAWKKAMVDKKLKEAMAKEEEERRKKEEELAKWQGVPEWKRKLMMEKEKKKAEEAEAAVDKTQVEREVKLRSMPTWKRNIVQKKLGAEGGESGAKGAPGFEETSTAL